MRIHSDLHTHTKYSHGKGTVKDNVEAAKKKGLTAIAITDHGPANPFGVGVQSLKVFSSIKADIDKIRHQWPNGKILLGVEANVLNKQGLLDITPEMIYQFDIVLAGLHLLTTPLSMAKLSKFLKSKVGLNMGKAQAKEMVANTDALIAAVFTYKIDIVTHPGHRLPIDTAALAKACVQNGTALEINTSHDHISVEYLKIAKSHGAKFVISSDAHHPKRVGDFDNGINLALKAGLTCSDILNAVE